MDVPDCPALPIYSSFPTCWVGLTFGLQSCCQRDLWLICFRKLRFCSASLYWLACRSRTRENCSIAWHRKKPWSVVNIYPVSPVSIGPKVGILNWRAILHETKCCRIDRVMSCPDHRCGACCLVPRQWLGNHPTTKILSIDVNCQFQGNLCQDPTCKPKTLRLIVLVILRKQEILQPWADEFPHKDYRPQSLYISAIWISTTGWLVISEILHTRLSFLRAFIKLKSFWWTICCAVALSHLATNRNLATGFLIQWEEFWNTDDLDNLDLAPPSLPLPEPCLAHLGIIDSVSPRLRRGKLQTNLTPLTPDGSLFQPQRFLTSGLNREKQCNTPNLPQVGPR